MSKLSNNDKTCSISTDDLLARLEAVEKELEVEKKKGATLRALADGQAMEIVRLRQWRGFDPLTEGDMVHPYVVQQPISALASSRKQRPLFFRCAECQEAFNPYTTGHEASGELRAEHRRVLNDYVADAGVNGGWAVRGFYSKCLRDCPPPDGGWRCRKC